MSFCSNCQDFSLQIQKVYIGGEAHFLCPVCKAKLQCPQCLRQATESPRPQDHGDLWCGNCSMLVEKPLGLKE